MNNQYEMINLKLYYLDSNIQPFPYSNIHNPCPTYFTTFIYWKLSIVPVDYIRSLTGLLNKDGDIGLFVTSGYFTSESERSARESHRHIKLLDVDSFITLWQEFYLKLTDDDKNMLPLHSIYFLGSND